MGCFPSDFAVGLVFLCLEEAGGGDLDEALAVRGIG